MDGNSCARRSRNPADRLAQGRRRGLGKQIVAEFVENAATMDLLARPGVDYAQGFHLGRPQPLADAIECVSSAGPAGARRSGVGPGRRTPSRGA